MLLGLADELTAANSGLGGGDSGRLRNLCQIRAPAKLTYGTNFEQKEDLQSHFDN